MNTDKTKTETCQVNMSDGQPCGRPIYNAPTGGDPQPVCLMHSRFLDKNRDRFGQEIEAMLNGTPAHGGPDGIIDFCGFVFPSFPFANREFTKHVSFHRAHFLEVADFQGVKFGKGANFSLAFFSKGARFTDASFEGRTFFDGASFGDFVHFGEVSFRESVSFYVAQFCGTAIFFRSQFLGEADFSGSRFHDPRKVWFFQVNQQSPVGLRAYLAECELNGVRFEDVNWFRISGRMVLLDEIEIRRRECRTYELVRIAYHRLLKGFEEVRAYDLAEDCYVGAMEMKRLDPKEPLTARALVTLYKWLSLYGSSYTRALGMLGAFLVTFALLFPVLGVGMTSPEATVQCSGAEEGTPEAAVISWGCAARHPTLARELWGTLGAGFWTAVDVATFQRNPTHEPATKWGRRLATLETIVIPGQVALFFLALRRRFKR